MLSLILSVGAMAQVDELLDKKISAIGEAATEIKDGGWYLLRNVGRNAYISEETNAMMMRDPAGQDDFAPQKAGLLFKVTKNGEYYNIMSGNGLYFSLGHGSAPISKTAVDFVIGLIKSEGNTNCFYFNDATTGYVANGNAKDNTFVGWNKEVPTSVDANSAYQFLEVTFEYVDLEKVVYTFTLDGETKYTQSQWCEVGKAFPDYTIASYHALTISAKPEGMVSATNCEQTIEMSVDESLMPFKRSTLTADGEFGNDMHWYTMTLSGTDLTCCDFVTPAANVSTKTPKNLYAFTGNPYDGYKIYNMYMGSSKVLWSNWFNNDGNPIPMTAVEDVTPGTDWLLNKNGDGYGLKRNGTNSGYVNKRNGNFSYWNSGSAANDGNSMITFTEVTSINELVANYKTEALAALDAWERCFDVADAKAAIEAIETTDYNSVKAIDNAILSVFENKYFTLRNADTDTGSTRYQSYLTAKSNDKNEAYGGEKVVDLDAVWTFKPYSTSVYVYNEHNNVYLGSPGSNGDLTENPTCVYNFDSNTNDKIEGVLELHCGSETLHMNNHNSSGNRNHRFLSSYDNNDAASSGHIEEYKIKDELGLTALVTDNAGNHAAEPALGQYPTEAYDALKAVADKANANIEEVNAAIAAFNKAKNIPVYFITSLHDGYAAGSAILYNGTSWKWGTANKYNKQMWMTIPAHNAEEAPVVDAYDTDGTSYEICDYLTGTVMRGKKVQIVKIDGWEGAYNLQYNADANSTDAAQHAKDTKDLVNWKPATATDSKASAWAIEFLGGTYYLDKLTDGHVTALSALQTAYDSKASFVNAEIGEGLGQYKGSKDALVSAVAAAKSIVEATMNEQAVMEVANIEAAATAINNGAAALTINLPAAGKYYRIQGACEASPANHYITGHTNADGGRIALTAEADASTIYYFDGTNLIAYQSGLVIGLSQSHWTFASIDDNSHPASTIEFEASPRTVGAYLVKSADVYMHYKTHEGAAEIDRCSSDAGHVNHDWYLTEVEALPVAISSVEHATFYAPVAVKVAEGVKAHTVTVSNDEWATLNEIEGGVIPANTGVILTGKPADYSFEITTADAFEGENLMAGTVAKTLVRKTANTEYYVLSKPEGAEEAGMYVAVNGNDNTTFYNAGHKAYLKVEGASNVSFYGFRFGGEEGTTGVEKVEIRNEKEEIFDLAGRRVSEITAPGIYIIDGHKVLVK